MRELAAWVDALRPWYPSGIARRAHLAIQILLAHEPSEAEREMLAAIVQKGLGLRFDQSEILVAGPGTRELLATRRTSAILVFGKEALRVLGFEDQDEREIQGLQQLEGFSTLALCTDDLEYLRQHLPAKRKLWGELKQLQQKFNSL